MSLRLIVFGAGGLAREVRDAALGVGRDVAAYAVDDAFVSVTDASRLGGVPVIGVTEAIQRLCPTEYGYVIAVGDPMLREHFASMVHGIARPIDLIAATAVVSPNAKLDPAVVIQAGAVVSDGAKVERHAYINIGACVAHDALVEELAVVGPHAMICGNAIIEARAYLGASVTVLPGVRIGRGAYVGAGATVLHDVTPGDTVAGVPAKSLRRKG